LNPERVTEGSSPFAIASSRTPPHPTRSSFLKRRVRNCCEARLWAFQLCPSRTRIDDRWDCDSGAATGRASCLPRRPRSLTPPDDSPTCRPRPVRTTAIDQPSRPTDRGPTHLTEPVEPPLAEAC
jgi:hypothetical protein